MTSLKLPFFDWEVPALRSVVPDHLAMILRLNAGPLVVPIDVVRKIAETHPVDVVYLDRFQDLLDGWRFAGAPPDRPGRREVFGVLAGDWRTAVLGTNRALDATHLITFHRVDMKRVTSKHRRGYLVEREG